jgi:membrane protease YdiL (CAAX protease family)
MSRNLYDSHAKGISWGGGFFMLVCFAIAGFLFASFISVYIWTSMTGVPVDQREEHMMDPANSTALKVMQIISSILIFLVPAILTAQLMNRKPFRLLGFKGKISGLQVIVVVGIMVAALFVSSFLSWINEVFPISQSLRSSFENLEAEYIRQVVAILGLNNIGEYLLALVIMAFLPALCEETLFRGGLQNFLTRQTGSFWISVIVVSLIFSVAHFSYFGFLSRLFLGIVLGLIFHYSGRLWLCIIAHFLNNAIAITIPYYFKSQGKSIAETLEQADSSWVGIFALPFLVVLIYYFIRISAGNKFSHGV